MTTEKDKTKRKSNFGASMYLVIAKCVMNGTFGVP